MHQVVARNVSASGAVAALKRIVEDSHFGHRSMRPSPEHDASRKMLHVARRKHMRGASVSLLCARAFAVAMNDAREMQLASHAPRATC